MTSIMRHVAEAFSPARQGTILNSHRVIGIATNTSMMLNCALVTYIRMTVDVRLPDEFNIVPRTKTNISSNHPVAPSPNTLVFRGLQQNYIEK